MSENRKILIIENQKFQYDLIKKNLEEYDYFPANGEFILFTDHVRVWINKQYNIGYRDKAWEYIENYIDSKEIELIVMDHILGGAHHCLTGIELATKLNKKRDEKSEEAIPVFFLSKTEHNQESRVKKYEEYAGDFPNTSIWVHKGFFGDEILDPDYFKERVIPKIEELLGKTEEQRFWDNLTLVQNLSFTKTQDPIKTALDKIEEKKYQDLSSELIKMINEVATSRTVNDLKLEILNS